MVRLIDADELDEFLVDPDTGFEWRAAWNEAIIDAKQHAKTIEAIPIDWIEEKVKEAEGSNHAEHWLAQTLKDLIEEWRKENYDSQ